jgi:hypothetical protein
MNSSISKTSGEAILNECYISTAAAVFKATGGQVPRQETKTYIGAGLAVLGVNLVRENLTLCMQRLRSLQ